MLFALAGYEHEGDAMRDRSPVESGLRSSCDEIRGSGTTKGRDQLSSSTTGLLLTTVVM